MNQTNEKINELKHCPLCNFDKKIAFKKHSEMYQEKFWETICPRIFKDGIFGKWWIECQNCGLLFTFGFGDMNKQNVINSWNMLPRKLIQEIKE